ncbi:MAG: Na+/H+ antiporter subunit E [Bacteroidales bacterium]
MKYIAYFILCLIIWFLLTARLYLENIVAGVLVSGITTLFFGRYFTEGVGKFLEPKRYFWLLVYLIMFIWECIKANFDVAYRVLHPAMPIRPGIVKVNVTIRSEFGKAILANSITMTPGTISVDLIGDTLYVHWINVFTDDPGKYSRIVSGRFENLLKKIFD